MKYADFPFLIYVTIKGQDPYITNRAPDLRSAINYCNIHDEDRTRLSILQPDGTWYEWPKEVPVVTEEQFLALDPDVVEMEIDPARANEIPPPHASYYRHPMRCEMDGRVDSEGRRQLRYVSLGL